MTQQPFIDLPHYTKFSPPTALFVGRIMASKATHEDLEQRGKEAASQIFLP